MVKILIRGLRYGFLKRAVLVQCSSSVSTNEGGTSSQDDQSPLCENLHRLVDFVHLHKEIVSVIECLNSTCESRGQRHVGLKRALQYFTEYPSKKGWQTSAVVQIDTPIVKKPFSVS